MSRLAQMQARFQQKQMQEKEEKLLKLYESQQQRAFDRVGRGSAGSNISGGTSPVAVGKVRQMFDERRQKAGIDRSYPLEPLKQTKSNGLAPVNRASLGSFERTNIIPKNPIRTSSSFKSTVQRTIMQSRPGKPTASHAVRQSLNATYANGDLIHENSTYEEEENSNPLFLLKNQQRELEMMMNNVNLDDEKFNNGSYDDTDGRNDDCKCDNEEMMQTSKKFNNNSSYEGNHSLIQAKKMPQAKVQPVTPVAKKERDVMKKPITKSQSSPVKAQPTSPLRSSSSSGHYKDQLEEKKSPMKSINPSRQQTSATRTSSKLAPSSKSQQSNRSGLAKQAPSSIVNRDDLTPCKHCGRRFDKDRIGLHEEICARTLKKKRKTYDPVKHRVQGTDAEGFVRKGKVSSIKKKPQSIGKPDWRRQHEEFIAAIRAAKMAQAHIAAGGNIRDLPPPPPSSNPDYVQCPHCGRRFNESAAARHIPKCANFQFNKPKAATSRKKF